MNETLLVFTNALLIAVLIGILPWAFGRMVLNGQLQESRRICAWLTRQANDMAQLHLNLLDEKNTLQATYDEAMREIEKRTWTNVRIDELLTWLREHGGSSCVVRYIDFDSQSPPRWVVRLTEPNNVSVSSSQFPAEVGDRTDLDLFSSALDRALKSWDSANTPIEEGEAR